MYVMGESGVWSQSQIFFARVGVEIRVCENISDSHSYRINSHVYYLGALLDQFHSFVENSHKFVGKIKFCQHSCEI